MAPPLFFFIFFISSIITSTNILQANGATWCVARSDASNQALQAALDYACGAGADCTPLLSEGLCFLPNTIQAHASYAFNSYFQKRAMAPGSCDFSGTATVARTDPSSSLPFHFLCTFYNVVFMLVRLMHFVLCFRLWILCLSIFSKVYIFFSISFQINDHIHNSFALGIQTNL